MTSLALMTNGQLHARTLHDLRKLHEVVTFPGGQLPLGSDERMDFEISWSLRTKAAAETLAEWDRRLPLMREAVDIVKKGRP